MKDYEKLCRNCQEVVEPLPSGGCPGCYGIEGFEEGFVELSTPQPPSSIGCIIPIGCFMLISGIVALASFSQVLSAPDMAHKIFRSPRIVTLAFYFGLYSATFVAGAMLLKRKKWAWYIAVFVFVFQVLQAGVRMLEVTPGDEGASFISMLSASENYLVQLVKAFFYGISILALMSNRVAAEYGVSKKESKRHLGGSIAGGVIVLLLYLFGIVPAIAMMEG